MIRIKQYFRLKVLIVLPIIFLFSQCQTEHKKAEISLSNSSAIDLTDKAISIERSKITNPDEDNQHPLIISSRGDTIPSQLNDLDGDSKWDELFFVVDLPASGTETYTLQ